MVTNFSEDYLVYFGINNDIILLNNIKEGDLLKFLIGILSVLSLQSYCLALTPQKLSGVFHTNNEISLVEIHHWEKGDWASQEGIARKKELTEQGYGCYRRSPQEFQCHMKTTTGEIPDEVKNYVIKYLKNLSIEFAGPYEDPKDMIDTSTEREWWIEGVVNVGQAKVRGYKWTHQYDTNADLVVLPVNDEQPIPWFIYKNNQLLHLPLQLTQKNGPKAHKVFRLEAQFVLQ
ncbi:MAG: hypothetical protein ACXVCN_19060 [Bdellovibrio sp.]